MPEFAAGDNAHRCKNIHAVFYGSLETEKNTAGNQRSEKTDFLKWLAAESRLPEKYFKDLGLASKILFDNIAKDSATVRQKIWIPDLLRLLCSMQNNNQQPA
ncbi:MAG: hypothetical protein R2875_14530 [Desulfobacterales bacterium]